MATDTGEMLHRYAFIYRLTANDLYGILTKGILTKKNLSAMKLEEEATALGRARVFGYTCSVVVLRALATECALKALAIRRKGKYRKDAQGHDLLVLFEDLDDNARTFIERLALDCGIASPRTILEKHRGDFVGWRYPWEGRAGHTNLLDLEKVLEVLMIAYKNKDFQALPPMS